MPENRSYCERYTKPLKVAPPTSLDVGSNTFRLREAAAKKTLKNGSGLSLVLFPLLIPTKVLWDFGRSTGVDRFRLITQQSFG
jgi:hypothetical protein